VGPEIRSRALPSPFVGTLLRLRPEGTEAQLYTHVVVALPPRFSFFLFGNVRELTSPPSQVFCNEVIGLRGRSISCIVVSSYCSLFVTLASAPRWNLVSKEVLLAIC